MGAGPADSGIYKSYYMLQEPVDQMRDFITDACAPPSPSTHSMSLCQEG